MRAIIKKGWADLAGRWWQSALIALSVGSAAALLYLGLVSLSAASSPYEKQMARANGAHAWFYLRDDAPGRAAADRIETRPEVAEAVRRQVLLTQLLSPESDKTPWVDLMPLPAGENPMMGYILLEGEVPHEPGTALLPVSVARYIRLNVGETVTVKTSQGPRALRVVGLIAEPKSCTFPRCWPHSLYVLPGTFAELVPAGSETTILLGVQLHDREMADAFVSQTRGAEAGALVRATPWHALQDFYVQDRIFNVVPILLFGVIAVAAAVMILANIIGGAVLGQYREIGVLKSLGFTGGQVLLLYVGQTLLLGVVGGALGLLGGHLLAVAALSPMAFSMGTPDVLRFMPGTAALVLLLLLPVAALFTALAAWRAVTLRPAVMLTDGYGAPRARTPMAVRVLAALKLPVTLLLGVKDAMARPARAVMTILSLAICLITILLSLNIPAIGQVIWENPELIGITWDMTVEPAGLSMAEAEEAVRQLPQTEGYYREIYRAVTVPDRQFDLGLRAVDGDWHKFGFRLIEGRLPEAPGEVLLASRAWERLGVTAGEQFRLQVGEQIRPVTVVGKYQDQIDSGRIMLMTWESLRQFAPAGEQRAFLRVSLEQNADFAAAHRSLLDLTDGRVLVYMEGGEMPDFGKDLIAMMEKLTWVMAAIAVLSVMGAALLTAREQMREVGIRKAIGMSPGQVLGSVAAGGAWVGLVGICLALPGGYLLQKVVNSVLAGVMGLSGMPWNPPGEVLLLVAGGGIGLSVLSVLPAAAFGARLVTARVLQAE